MTIPEAMAFGLIQGLTEFLPVSSSGHLALLKNLWGYSDISILFDIMLHVATLGAVLIVFRSGVWKIIASFFRWIRGQADVRDMAYMRVAGVIIIATLITGVLGIFIEKVLGIGEHIQLVSSCFLLTALLLVVSEVISRRRAQVPSEENSIANERSAEAQVDFSGLRYIHGVILGLFQGLGVFPGVSRSGATISAGLFCGLPRGEAGELSFLMSIPAIFGAVVLKLPDAGALSGEIGLLPLLAGMLVSFVSGWIALVYLMKLVRGGKLYFFAFYLIPLAIAGLIFL